MGGGRDRSVVWLRALALVLLAVMAVHDLREGDHAGAALAGLLAVGQVVLFIWPRRPGSSLVVEDHEPELLREPRG